jgi:muramidase (phage lysozyme)
MAKFTQDIRQTQDPNYVNMSRGIDAPPPNRSYEYLFKGLANVGKGLVDAIDEGIQTKARQEVDTKYNALWGDMGVDVALANQDPLNLDRSTTGGPTGARGVEVRTDEAQQGNPGGLPGENPPAGIARTGHDMERLRAAFDDGRLSPTYYYTRAEAIARQLRSRYPGYEEVVDQLIKSKLGVTPANELRKSLLNDLEMAERKRASGADDLVKFARSKGADVQPDWWERYGKGQPYSMEETAHYVARRERERADTNDVKSQLELRRKQGENVKEDALAAFTGQAGQLVTRIIGDTMLVLEGQQGGDIFRQISQAVSMGKPLSEQDRQQFEAVFNNTQTKIELALDDIAKQMKNGVSYEMLIGDRTKLEDAKKMAMTRLETMRKSLVDGNFGLLSANARAIKAIGESDTLRALLDKNDFWRKLQVIQNLGGSQVAQYWLSQQGNLGSLDAALKNLFLSRLMTEDASLMKQFEELQRETERKIKSGDKNPNLNREVINQGLAILKDPNTPAQIAEQMAKNIFGPENRGFLRRYKGQMDLFNLMVSPEMTTRMQALGGESWKNYVSWIGDSFQMAHKQTFDNFNKNVENNPGFKVTRDEATGLYRFETGLAPNRKPPPGMDSAIRMMQSSVNEVNNALTQVLDILKKDGKGPQELFNTLDAAGMGLPNVPQPKTEKKSEAPANRSLAFAPVDLDEMGASVIQANLTTGGMPLRSNAADRSTDPVLSTATPIQRAFLNAVAGGESAGAYNIRFTPRGGAFFDSYEQHPGIFEKRADGRKSSAAGRYQFVKSTWDALGGGEFTPERQDEMALKYAALKYKGETGRDLWKDLEEDGLTNQIMDALAPTWEAFYKNKRTHAKRFWSSLARYEKENGEVDI